MSLSRIAKMLARHLVVSWRDQPTRYDIEALQANVERVGLVIKVRWTLVAALGVYSVLGGWAYTIETPVDKLADNMIIPAAAMVFVLGYNTFYRLTYRQLGNIAVLNHAQLMFDALVVAVLVYYSGGVHSWFWAMYALFVLEAAFILPRRWQVWAITGFCLLVNGFVLWSVYFGLLPPVAVPFISGSLYKNFTFVAVAYLWQITVLAGAASIGTMMTGALRRRETMLAQSSIVDEKTGLYNRAYFNRALASELQRASRDGRSLIVLLVDIDDFGRFNKTFGLQQGDAMLRATAERMHEVLCDCGYEADGDVNLIARFGGEEFAIILTQCAGHESLTVECGLEVADALRAAIADIRIGDAGVTVSIGIAVSPQHGLTFDEVLTAADTALQEAVLAGGNRVCAASVMK